MREDSLHLSVFQTMESSGRFSDVKERRVEMRWIPVQLLRTCVARSLFRKYGVPFLVTQLPHGGLCVRVRVDRATVAPPLETLR